MKNKGILQKTGLMVIWSLLPFGKARPLRYTDSSESGTSGQFKLYDNYPNPFRTITIIYFSLMNESQVRIDISDASGKKIMTLINEQFEAGVQRVPLYKVNNEIALSPGTYTYRLIVSNESGKFSQDKLLTLL
jgi:hypothetical protein